MIVFCQINKAFFFVLGANVNIALSDLQLVSALEFRCCREVLVARAKLTFDGSIERLSCVTQHEDYEALTNRTVLLQVAPLLRDKNGRSYRR